MRKTLFIVFRMGRRTHAPASTAAASTAAAQFRAMTAMPARPTPATVFGDASTRRCRFGTGTMMAMGMAQARACVRQASLPGTRLSIRIAAICSHVFIQIIQIVIILVTIVGALFFFLIIIVIGIMNCNIRSLRTVPRRRRRHPEMPHPDGLTIFFRFPAAARQGSTWPAVGWGLSALPARRASPRSPAGRWKKAFGRAPVAFHGVRWKVFP